MWCALVDRDSVQGNLTLLRPCLQVPGESALWIIVHWICKGEIDFSTLCYYWSICCCSVTQLCLALCDPMDGSTPGFPVLHHLLSLLRLMSLESVMPSRHLILCHPFSSCSQSFPASGSFPMSYLFASGGQSIGASASASASVLPMSIQDSSPVGWTDWISLQSKGFSRVFSNTMVQKHQFLGAQPSLWSNSHIHTWLLEKP